MKVGTLMSRRPVVVAADETLEHAIARLNEHGFRHLPVTERGRLAGVISERDLLEATGWQPERFFESSEGRKKVVRDYMHVPVETADPGEDLETAAGRMQRWKIGCLPVVEAGKLVGVVTETDVLGAFVRKCQKPGRTALFDPVLSEVMTRDFVSLPSDAVVAEAVKVCRERGVRHLAVSYDGWFVGLASDRDLRLSLGRGEPDRRLERIMATDVVALGPEARLSEAAERMLRHKIGAVAVTEERRLSGLVTTSTLLAHCSSADWDG